MDCNIMNILVQSNDLNFTIVDSDSLSNIKKVLEKRKKEPMTFLPKCWLEISGSSCNFRVRVSNQYVKIDGITYVLKENLEEIVSHSIK